MDYSNVGVAVAECVRDMNRKYRTSFCSEGRNIFAPDIIDRVKYYSNGIAFLYETKMDTALFGTRNAVDVKALQEFFRNNLTLENGYFFTGPIYVTSVDSDKITIEVQGVDRNYIYGDGDFYDGYR